MKPKMDSYERDKQRFELWLASLPRAEIVYLGRTKIHAEYIVGIVDNYLLYEPGAMPYYVHTAHRGRRVTAPASYEYHGLIKIPDTLLEIFTEQLYFEAELEPVDKPVDSA